MEKKSNTLFPDWDYSAFDMDNKMCGLSEINYCLLETVLKPIYLFSLSKEGFLFLELHMRVCEDRDDFSTIFTSPLNPLLGLGTHSLVAPRFFRFLPDASIAKKLLTVLDGRVTQVRLLQRSPSQQLQVSGEVSEPARSLLSSKPFQGKTVAVSGGNTDRRNLLYGGER
jgi:hypothetical protein